MRSTSGMKPMSSMRSASSMTSTLHVGKQDLATLEHVEHPARGRDQDVDAAIELLLLIDEAFAADKSAMLSLLCLP